MKHRIALLGATLLTASTIAVAVASPGERRGPDMSYADTNDDGVVTVEEVRALHDQRFQDADRNGDGALNVAEMREAMMREHAERRVQRLDTDGDGRVSTEEYAYPMERRLMMMDRNGDGRLEPVEARRGNGRHWDDNDDRYGHHYGHHEGRHHDDD